MKKTIVEFEDVLDLYSFMDVAKQNHPDSDIECIIQKKRCTIQDKQKEHVKKAGKRNQEQKPEILHHYKFKNGYKGKGLLKRGNLKLELLFVNGEKRMANIGFKFNKNDTTDALINRIIARIKGEVRSIIDYEYAESLPTELF